jgi:signal transduction histidine kinase/ligand-binding sensor domain-containing protein/AraC-like DNA-binding protein
MYDGLHVQVYKPTSNNPNSLSGNIIEGVMEAEDNILWIATNHGFNRLDKKKRTIEYHDEFQGKYHWAKTRGNELFAIHEDNLIDYYDRRKKSFIRIPYNGISNGRIRHFFIDESNTLWILPDDGNVIRIAVSFTGNHSPHLTPMPAFDHKPLLYIFQEKERIYLIDRDCFLYEYNAASEKKSLVMNLQAEIEENGIISTIIRDNDDYLVAFQTNGLIRLKNTPENEIKYRTERITIYCGVFSLCKDEWQDIIWIGTDGQGVYMYSRDSFSFQSTTFSDIPFAIQKPVRALFLDSLNTLWVGTKDDGMITIENYYDNEPATRTIKHYTSGNSPLVNNTVYAFAQSRRNLIWIGSDGPGLNYFSYREKKIKPVPFKCKEHIVYVHSICEVNDSTLWLATVGDGILKVIISGDTDHPVIESVKRTTFIKDELSYNYFFSSYRENDSILWFGNRGYGIQRLDLHTEIFRQILFQRKDVETINDILSIHKDKQGNLWFGTSFGITKLVQDPDNSISYENYNEIEGLPNNTIHGILEDDHGNLWLSTNNGIVQFDVQTKNFRIYNQLNGLDVIEYSDGAYFRDDKTGVLFFGGTNGFVSISQDVFIQKTFIPPIYFTGLKIYENEYNLADFMRKKKNREYISLTHQQNFFSIAFIALDYINGQNSKYVYNLENFNDKWIENRFSNVVTFTKVPPGEYILHVRYENGENTPANDIYSLRIVILPPWYAGLWAYLAYILLAIAAFFFVLYKVHRRYTHKREMMIETMNRQQKEEVYESKLRFFTNITHEFSTPLTLIYGPCARIVSYAGCDAYVKRYASLILKNAERLNDLIQELIEFRRIETGHQSCRIERLSISGLAKSITDSFVDLSETKNIDFHLAINDNMDWNTDRRCFTKILTNLLSNAFKYTPDNGKVTVDIHAEGEILSLHITNTGKGIKEEDIPFVFDRYTVLENFERQTRKGISSRNGLGLAICHNMVHLLNGQITVESTPGIQTTFCVELPAQPLSSPSAKEETPEEETVAWPENNPGKPVWENTDYKLIPSRSTILLIDDDPEMLWFVSEIFKEHYNMIPVENPAAVPEILTRIQPHLILSDIMMNEVNGITLMKQIKADKRMAHIPYILLSAKNRPEEQVEGIEAGAEFFITKPFNVDYLRSVVDHLLQRQEDLKDYFNSSISAFEFMDGRFIHKEDKAFIEKLIRIIEKNMMNPDFSTEQLASRLGLSVRHLYRKLKIIDCSPSDLIKEYRLSVSEKLLVTTQMPIEEIMDKTGFSNRGTFFRIFSAKYGMTPKTYRNRQSPDSTEPQTPPPHSPQPQPISTVSSAIEKDNSTAQ